MCNLKQMFQSVEIIRKKRDGVELASAEIAGMVDGFVAGEIPDYQMSAWLMAIFFKGLSINETVALTDALVDSGGRLDLSSLGRTVLDKHSTGGVGDKVSLVLGPVIASCGALFGKMSGRGLAHTGGTVDKLESIPGFRTRLSPEEFEEQLRETGICIAGQSEGLVPADMKIYALRDVTGTIESNPLIAASIMSKKIAGGASAVVLDIKVGGGAFFKTIGHASGAAHLMRKIGELRGVDVLPVFTSMEQPLGKAVGNALEVMEAIASLRDDGPADLNDVVVALAARLLPLSDLGWDRGRSEQEARKRITSGAALEKFREWISAQGGDTRFIDNPDMLPSARHVLPVPAIRSGFIAGIDALAVGGVALKLGAGRHRKDEAIDHSAGVVLNVKTGDRISEGESLASVHSSTEEKCRAAVEAIAKSYRISDAEVEPAPVLLD
ncbi:MAG: thymidine phosphorylase [Thermoleophilia bacterium]